MTGGPASAAILSTTTAFSFFLGMGSTEVAVEVVVLGTSVRGFFLSLLSCCK
jgi:hypothetical protein